MKTFLPKISLIVDLILFNKLLNMSINQMSYHSEHLAWQQRVNKELGESRRYLLSSHNNDGYL